MTGLKDARYGNKNSTVIILADVMIRLVIGGHDWSCATGFSGEQDLWARTSHHCSILLHCYIIHFK